MRERGEGRRARGDESQPPSRRRGSDERADMWKTAERDAGVLRQIWRIAAGALRAVGPQVDQFLDHVQALGLFSTPSPSAPIAY